MSTYMKKPSMLENNSSMFQSENLMSSIHSIESEGSIASNNNNEVKISGNFPDSVSLAFFIYTAFNISK